MQMRRWNRFWKPSQVGWIGFAASVGLLWLMRSVVERGSVDAPYGAALLILLALAASLFIVWMAMRTRMTLPRLLAYISLQFYIIVIYAMIYARIGLLDGGGELLHDLGTGFYFSLVTWTTLGYGDLQPPEPLRLLAGSEAILGYISMGVLVALLLQWLTAAKKTDV